MYGLSDKIQLTLLIHSYTNCGTTTLTVLPLQRERESAGTFDVLAFKPFRCTQMQSIKQTEINFSHKMQFAINWDSVIEKLRIKPLIDKAIEFVHCYFCNSSSSSKQPAAPTTNTHTPILIILLKLDRRLK